MTLLLYKQYKIFSSAHETYNKINKINNSQLSSSIYQLNYKKFAF
jgi:hypothetical protein